MASYSVILRLITLILYLPDIARSTNVIRCLATQCKDTTINCPDDGADCFISCSTPNACQNAIINCPKNQQCLILCDEINSCQGATFNAQSAATLDITACQKHQSCLDLTIYCPQYTTDTNCFIEGNDNLGSNMQIYAKNGWDDIEIDYNGTFNNNLAGTMHCNTNYDISCDIASDKWSCNDRDSRCNDMLSQQNEYSHSNNIDSEMVVIVSTLVAAVLFIAICCWHNNRSRKTLSTTQTSPTATATAIYTNTVVDTKRNYVRGENGVGTGTHTHDHNTNINVNIDQPKSPKSKSISTVSAQPTAVVATAKPAMSLSSELAIDIDTDKNKTNDKMVGGSINMVATVQNGHERKSNQHIEQPQTRNINRRNKRKNIQNIAVSEQKRSTEKESELTVIDEHLPSTPPKSTQMGSHNYNFSGSEQLQFKPNISDSEPMTIKPGPGTWDMFEKENGILADQYDMDQMMGYLEEGAIACSYE